MTRQESADNREPLPFDSYPFLGRNLFLRVRGYGGSRLGYALRHMQHTGQTSCSFCGLDLTSTYENWLTISLDHVVPANICRLLGICDEWTDDHSNRVLCCAACNAFKNKWTPEVPPECPTTLDEFFNMRDAMFIERRSHVRQRHIDERRSFDSKPWDKK